jgi:hypothetical protein
LQHKRKQLIGQRRIVAERNCFEFSPIHAFDASAPLATTWKADHLPKSSSVAKPLDGSAYRDSR